MWETLGYVFCACLAVWAIVALSAQVSRKKTLLEEAKREAKEHEKIAAIHSDYNRRIK